MEKKIKIGNEEYVVEVPDEPPPAAPKEQVTSTIQYAEQDSPDYYDYRNALAQGLTFNLADEAAAGLGAAGDWIKGDREYGKNYDRRVADIRKAIKESEEKFPKTNFAMNLAGGIPSMFVPGVGATRGLTLGQKIAQGMKTGAMLGAVGGAGNVEGGLENRVRGAAVGGGVGAGLGLGVPLAAAGVGAVARRVGDSAVGQAVGGAARRGLAAVTPAPVRRAVSAFNRTPPPPEMTPQLGPGPAQGRLPAGAPPAGIPPHGPPPQLGSGPVQRLLPPGAGGPTGAPPPPPGGVPPPPPAGAGAGPGGSQLSERGARKVIEALERQGYTPEQAQQYLASYGNPNMRIVDIGDETRMLADQAVMTPSRQRAPMTGYLEDRTLDAGERIYEATQQVSGVRRDVAQYVEALENTLTRRLQPEYTRVFNAAPGPVTSPVIQNFMQRPLFRTMYEQAVESNINHGVPDPGTLNLRMIDTIKKKIDNLISKEATSGAAKSERVGLRQMRDAFLREVDEIFPDYARVRGRYADVLDMLDTAEDGRDFAKLRPEDLARTMHQLGSDALRQAYRVGAVSRIRDMVLGPNRNVNAWQTVMGGRYNPARMEALFGGARGYNQFLRNMLAEREMIRSSRAVGTGSQSGRRLLSQGEFSDDLIEAGGQAATGNLGNAASSLLRKVVKGDPAPMNEAVLPFLYQNPAEGFDILNRVYSNMQRNAQRPAATPSLLGTVAGRVGGIFGQ